MPLQAAFAFNANELFTSLGNMIISQWVASDNVAKDGKSLLDVFKTDGSLYGDSKLFYATQALKSVKWKQDSPEALNVLATHRPPDPKVQKIVLNEFRQIQLTTDSVLSKRAWSDEGTFSMFTTVLIGWMGDTKYLYDESIINCAIGTSKATAGRQNQSVTFETGASSKSDIEAQNRINAQKVAKVAADIITDITSVRNARFYNDYGFRRKYRKDDFITVWNADAINKITKIDLPTIFHDNGLDKVIGDPYILPKEYFGTIITSSNVSSYSAATATTGKPITSGTGAYTPGSNNANGMICSLIELEITVGGTKYEIMPGDEIPAGTILASAEDADAGKMAYGTVYIYDDTVLFKIIHKNAFKYMSAFETMSEFWNPKNLSTNRYLTFGYSDPFTGDGIRLLNYPLITVTKA